MFVCFLLEITFASCHKCDGDQLYLNGLHTFFKDLLTTLGMPAMRVGSRIKFIKIGKLNVTSWRTRRLDLKGPDVDIGYRAKIQDILSLSTKLLQQTNIECIQIGGLKLLQQHIEWIKFWFVNPFGEYSYDTSVDKKPYQLKPFKGVFKYRPGSGILTLSAWKQQVIK